MKRVLVEHRSPVNNQIVYEDIYRNMKDPSIRGSYIYSGPQNSQPADLEGWEYVYTSRVTPRAWAVFEENNYIPCWAQEKSPCRGFAKAKEPKILSGENK